MMKKMTSTFRILFISVCSLCLSTQILSSSIDESEFFKVVKKAYKETRKLKKESRVKLTKQKENDEQNICVGCIELRSLTYQVNNILYKVSKQSESENPEKKSLEYVEQLDAMFHYTMTKNSLGENECHKVKGSFNDQFTKEFYGSFQEDESEVIFSNFIPASSIQSIHLRDGQKRTYFYRGKPPHRDVVIRIDVNGDSEDAKVTYYKMAHTDDYKTTLATEKEITLMRRNRDKKKVYDKKGYWLNNDQVDSSSNDYFNYGLGVDYEHDGYIPKRLTLIKGESLTPVTEDFSIKTKAEVSSSRIKGNVLLTNEKGEEYVEVELKTDEAELRVPTKIDIFSTGYELKSTAFTNTNHEHGIDFEVLGDPRMSSKFKVKSTDMGTAYSLENIHQLDNRQSVSLKLSDEGSERSAFVRYELKF